MHPLPDDDFYARHGTWPWCPDDRDARLVLATVLDLTDDPRTRNLPIRVSAQNDVVILTGTVASQADRDAAASVTRETPGARDLCNVLRVSGDTTGEAYADELEAIAVPTARRRPRPHRWVTFWTISAWCTLPVGAFVAHLAGVPMLSIVFAVTAIAVSLARSGGQR